MSYLYVYLTVWALCWLISLWPVEKPLSRGNLNQTLGFGLVWAFWPLTLPVGMAVALIEGGGDRDD